MSARRMRFFAVFGRFMPLGADKKLHAGKISLIWHACLRNAEFVSFLQLLLAFYTYRV